MRITGGNLSGRQLLNPATRATRPMRDAVRLALFSILGSGVEGKRFLDLFAGTGAVGIEALSRGALSSTFVENGQAALSILGQNLEALGLLGESAVLDCDVFLALEQLALQAPFELVFVGPPYGHGLAQKTLQALAETPLLSPEAVVVVEVFHKEELAPCCATLVEQDTRRYGDNKLAFFHRQPP